MKRDWGCNQTCCYGSGRDHAYSAHCKCHSHALLDSTASLICQRNCMCSHSLTQFCQNDLVNLNTFNSKVFFKPNHFDRAGLGCCSCYSSTKSNFNFRGFCSPPPQHASCMLPIILHSRSFLHCSLLSLQLCCLQGNTVSQISEMWV